MNSTKTGADCGRAVWSLGPCSILIHDKAVRAAPIGQVRPIGHALSRGRQATRPSRALSRLTRLGPCGLRSLPRAYSSAFKVFQIVQVGGRSRWVISGNQRADALTAHAIASKSIEPSSL